jgi:hypothetical protein
LDSLRGQVQQDYGRTVQFQVHRMSLDRGEATVEVTCIQPKASDNAKEVPVPGIPRLRATVGLTRSGTWEVTELAEVGSASSAVASRGISGGTAKASAPAKSSQATTRERKAILDALRLELVAQYKRPILFQVKDLKVMRADREAVVKVRCLRPNADGTEGTPYKDIAPVTAIMNVDTDGNWGVSDWGGPGDFEQN